MTTRENTPNCISAELVMGEGQMPTRREWEVLQALLAGHATHEAIGEALTISHGTVGVHIGRLLAKTGAVNLADLVLMATGRKRGHIDFADIFWS